MSCSGVGGRRYIALATALSCSTSFVGVPAVAVPTGAVEDLPRGVQIIAAMHREREDVCLAAAAS